MSEWERWAKRLAKGAIWLAFLLTLAWLLEIDPTWRVFLLIVACSLVDDILDAALPTVAVIAEERTK
jgi:hypothetical protein